MSKATSVSTQPAKAVDSADAAKKRKHRSPNYPAISLEKAIAKAGLIYAPYKRHHVPVDRAITTMDYKSGSSVGQQAVATLIYFGLAEDQGVGDKRQIRITERGAKILAGHSDRDKLIQEAALLPPIHKEIWEKFHKGLDGLAPDATVKQYLEWDRDGAKFNPDSSAAFIDEFKQSIAFAKLDSSASMSEDQPDMIMQTEDGQVLALEVKKNPPPSPGAFPLPVLMDDGTFQMVYIPTMTEKAFAFLKTALETYKPAIVRKPTDSD